MRLAVGFFPGAGMVHLYHADASGIFTEAGLDVDLVEVRSSDEQLRRWDSGTLDVMHTSPDHLLRGRQRDPVVLRAESLGELTLHASPGALGRSDARWGVDGPDSAFALVLRRLLDHLGAPCDEAQLVAVGGTQQRWTALRAGDIDGAVLHTPFSGQAEAQGFARLVGHRECMPLLTTTVVVTPRADAGSPRTRRYLLALERSRQVLIGGGPPAVARALAQHCWDSETADAAASSVLRQLAEPPTADMTAGLAEVIGLRQRSFPDWKPSQTPASLAVQVT